MESKKICAATGGDRYVPANERAGERSVVYFTRDISAEGLIRIFRKVGSVLQGKVAVKVHTGEKHGPNILPRSFVKALMESEIKDGTIIETNTYYDGDRYTTEKHRETLEVNGWNFCDVDIIDAEGTAMLPVRGGKWYEEMSVGKGLTAYDSLLALTHFKGHTTGGFGGSNKNIGIGCADGRVGKGMIHADPVTGYMWAMQKEEFMERMTESTKACLDFFGGRAAFINVMRNMSVSCDCEGVEAMPVVTPNVGIVASLDLLAADQACVDMIYAMKEADSAALRERIESRHGLRQLSYMKELGMGNDLYTLIDIDCGREISLADAVKELAPFADDGLR
ncbi:MAG: DUF362 domain-containing protein [Clostridia bacterium]|nr:DUF362 domain-containing protein [Clostridia bacterium]